MTTPPHKLIEKLSMLTVLDLRNIDGTLHSRVPYTHALGLAQQGLIEGVGSKSGAVKYLRFLNPNAIELAEAWPEAQEKVEKARSHPMNARTELGAYRQHLEFGSVWALCLCRGAGA